MISVSNLEKSYGADTLFAGVSFQLDPGKRYGLVGANGSGKTTFLNVLTGDIEATEGEVAVPQRLRLGVLRQDQFLYEDESILDVTLMGNAELWRVMSEKEELLAKADEYFDAERFTELEEKIQLYDGYTAEARAGAILEGLGLPAGIHQNPLSTLSGGFKLRVLLAQVLAGAPDVLLLDEPTNHLDILSIRWLETFLRDYEGTAVIISHDHRFLDNISTNILDVDYQTVTLYRGNYSDFIKAKRIDRERRERDIAGREREIAHHQKFVDRFRAKASKARQAQSKLRLIEKKAEEIVELPPSSRRYPNFRFDQERDPGREVLKVKGVKKAFDDNEVLHGVDLLLHRGDRLAIMGPNGIGKSTLLKIIMDEVQADAGDVEWGYETRPGYFAQDHHESLSPPNATVQSWLGAFCPGQSIGFIRGQLGMTLFSGDDAAKPLSALSGGEAARLVFTQLAVTKPNVLVLDEPTNHLDLEAIEALVEALKKYPGTLILVSHDRWFVSQLATRVVEIKPNEIRDFQGTYEQYVHFCGDDHLDSDRVVLKARRDKRQEKKGQNTGGDAADAGAERPGNERRKKGAKGAGNNQGANGSPDTSGQGGKKKNRNRNSKRRTGPSPEELLQRIDEAEKRIEAIDADFCRPDFFQETPTAEAQALQEERESLQASVTELTAQWEKLEAERDAGA